MGAIGDFFDMDRASLIAVAVIAALACLVYGVLRKNWTDVDFVRLFTILIASLVGVLVVAEVFDRMVSIPDTNKNLESLEGIASTVIAMVGTLVGFVAGQAAGAAGKEKAEDRATEVQKTADTQVQQAQQAATQAQNKAAAFAALVDPNSDAVKAAFKNNPTLFT
jgi:hypothetical protein